MIWHHWNFYLTAPNSTNCWCGTEGFKMAVAHKRGATESQVASRPGNKAASPGGGCVMSKHPKHQHSRNITEDECRVIRGSMYTVMSQFVNIMHCSLMHFHKCPSPLRGQRSMKMVGNLTDVTNVCWSTAVFSQLRPATVSPHHSKSVFLCSEWSEFCVLLVPFRQVTGTHCVAVLKVYRSDQDLGVSDGRNNRKKAVLLFY